MSTRFLVLAVATLVGVIGCQPARPEPAPTTAPTTAVATPSPSPDPAGILYVRGIREGRGCGAIGGCRYQAQLHLGDEGWRAGFVSLGDREMVIGAGFPERLEAGRYRLTLTAHGMSDAITNGVQSELGIEAECETSFEVGPGAATVQVVATFSFGTCVVERS